MISILLNSGFMYVSKMADSVEYAAMVDSWGGGGGGDRNKMFTLHCF